MEAYVMQGDRGGKILVVRNFCYLKHQMRGDFIHWRCWRGDSRAKVTTNVFDVDDSNRNVHVHNQYSTAWVAE